jgi:hypothetical protein
MHYPGKISERSLEKKVKMIFHTTIDKENSFEPLMGQFYISEKSLPVFFGQENRGLFVSPRSDMIKSSRKLDP